MSKIRRALLAGVMTVLAGTATVGVAGSASAATTWQSQSPAHRTCTIPNSTYTFRYDVNWSRSGSEIRIDDVKVTDAAGGHYVYDVYASVSKDGLELDNTGEQGLWAYGVTKYPRVTFHGGHLPATKSHPLVVTTGLTGYTNSGSVTPICVGAPAKFWA